MANEVNENVEAQVTGPIMAVAEDKKGMAAKNATMKDGPPEKSEEGGEKPGKTQTAYEQYLETIGKIADADLNPLDFALAHSEALVKLGAGSFDKGMEVLKTIAEFK